MPRALATRWPRCARPAAQAPAARRARLLRARLLRGKGRLRAALQEHDALELLLSDEEDEAVNACDAAELLLANGQVSEATERLADVQGGPFSPPVEDRLQSLLRAMHLVHDRPGYQ